MPPLKPTFEYQLRPLNRYRMLLPQPPYGIGVRDEKTEFQQGRHGSRSFLAEHQKGLGAQTWAGAGLREALDE